MIEAYRGLGGTAILYSEMFKSVVENPRYHHAEVVQIGVENEKMQREMENFGVDFYKMHRTYQKSSYYREREFSCTFWHGSGGEYGQNCC